MRYALVATLALGACGADSVHLAHHSTLVNATRGLVLLGGGVGHGAMLDTTCVFDGIDGFVTADIDLPTTTERITGHDPSTGVVLGVSAHGIHPMVFGQRRPDLDIPMSGVLDAQPVGDGVAWLRREQGACFVGEQTSNLGLPVERAVGACGPEARLLASTRWGLLAVHDGDVLTHFGSASFGPGEAIAAHHAAFDHATGGLLVAVGPVVTRYPAGGANPVDASVDAGADVVSLASLGARGGFAVVTDAGELAIHGDDGQVLSRSRLPGPAVVVTSDDGRDLSLVTPSEAHNYSIEDGPPRLAEIDPPELFQD